MTIDDKDERDAEREGLAGEYVLGTLDAEERTRAEELIAQDGEFALLVKSWERRLGELTAMVASVEPPDGLWAKIRDEVAKTSPEGAFHLPPAEEPKAEPEQPSAQVIDLTPRLRRWRFASAITGLAAACLAALVVLGIYNPDILPPGLRPQPEVRVQTVEKIVEKEVPKIVEKVVEVPAKAGKFVAVLQKDAASPAFLLTVDTEAKTITVRAVSAPPEPGKSYELWLVSSKFPAPRSLGVIGAQEFTVRPALANYDAETISGATYAVSIEPEGGSPTGAVTGPVVFSGKLIEARP